MKTNLLAALRAMPPGSMVPTAWVCEQIEADTPAPVAEPAPVPNAEPGWREKLWTAPSETRMGVKELAEAVGRPPSWCYRHTSQKSGLPLLPHRKLDGELTFLVGEIRAWVRDHEEVLRPGRVDPAPSERPHLRAS